MSQIPLCIEYEKPPKIMMEIAKLLEKNNHRCVSIIGTYNHKLIWCEKDICICDIESKSSSSEDEIIYV